MPQFKPIGMLEAIGRATYHRGVIKRVNEIDPKLTFRKNYKFPDHRSGVCLVSYKDRLGILKYYNQTEWGDSYFHTERRALEALAGVRRTPNIMEVYYKPQRAILKTYIPGKTLNWYWNPAQFHASLVEITEAVHRRGVAFLDLELTLSNILISEGEAWLYDFDLSKLREDWKPQDFEYFKSCDRSILMLEPRAIEA